MSRKKQRRPWSAAKKLQIVLESMQSDDKTAGICRREGVAPSQVCAWRKKVLSSAEAIFSKKPDGAEDLGPTNTYS